ncbi:universal stress protein [Tsukamurella soli]|uniref:Universal stress protein n=1 Tax=Tsukamurella soli TaxID=644556 RepID=A0ABP8JXV2_9ACTN
MTEHPMRPFILAGVDGSPAASRAVTWAAAEAHSRGVALLLATVIDIGTEYSPYAGVTEELYGRMQEDARNALAAAEQQVVEQFPAVPTSVVVKSGPPAAGLITLSRDALLTVVGATGRGRFSSILLGTVALALVTSDSCPVAVIRGVGEDDVVPQTGPVVLGIDGTKGSDAAIRWAFDEASRRATTLTAVHTWTDRTTATARVYAPQTGKDYDAADAEHSEILAERLAGWQEKYPDVTVRRVMTPGEAADTLLTHARGAQLVVVGSRGHGDATGVVFGSVSRMLIHHSPCPVLVARNRPATASRSHGD